jgi:hypothetical protein
MVDEKLEVHIQFICATASYPFQPRDDPAMGPLLFTCPDTNQQAPTGIETDVQSLRASWALTLKIDCPQCGKVHEVSVRDAYINGALDDAANSLRRAR